jgi:hypothetical protein
MQGMQS